MEQRLYQHMCETEKFEADLDNQLMEITVPYIYTYIQTN